MPWRKRTQLEFVVVLGIVALVAGIVFPTFERFRQSSRRVDCSARLRRVGQGLLVYANRNGGVWPATLDELTRSTVLPKSELTCVASGKPFFFVRPGGVAESSGSDDVIAYEPPEYHDGDGSNALFGDGPVSWLSPPALRAAVTRASTWPTSQPR